MTRNYNTTNQTLTTTPPASTESYQPHHSPLPPVLPPSRFDDWDQGAWPPHLPLGTPL
eukprot:CAMPEP_0119531804 /NCGR_PEP_ID=MMETSP1344-20130328/45438_1 /TAXON_ID=236787 /ORGANISM="Florenciella parvula, Strain CCMP2471" /LENGTH=57 /DNA_ID=CAMNT_0007572147 /DNA_START=76 /DNA_END=245 /DNA_ORIENTATION=+